MPDGIGPLVLRERYGARSSIRRLGSVAVIQHCCPADCGSSKRIRSTKVLGAAKCCATLAAKKSTCLGYTVPPGSIVLAFAADALARPLAFE